MHKSLVALGLLAGVVNEAPAAAAAFVGTSTGVTNPDTGEAEQYTVTITFDNSASPYPVFHRVTVNAPYTPYDYAYYNNVTAISVVGQRYNVSLTGGFSGVSTLASSRAHDGNAGVQIGAGSDSTVIGYSLTFIYLPQTAFGSTAMPAAMDIASAFENGFNLTEYYYEGDPADESIASRELLNFRLATGGLVAPAATAGVPEPTTWTMMVVGFGAMGYAMRRRRLRVAFG